VGQVTTSGWGTTSGTPSLRLLVVGANQRWTRVVTAAAARLGASVIHSASNSSAALFQVLAAPQPYSLILLQARQSDSAADDLADLTSGDVGSNTGLLLLGDTGRHPPGSIVVEHPTRAAISKALSQHSWKSEEVIPALSKAQLQEALNGSMLKLRYQPIVQLSDRKPLGLEVLTRLDHPEFGMLSADQFIPQIEAAGLSRQFTQTMITQAIQETCANGLIELGFCVGLNMPLNVLLMPDIFELLQVQRMKCSIPPDRIVIELTETQPVQDLKQLRGPVGRLRDIGYRVAIDDATPQMANVAGMMEIGFTTLKFDKAIVQGARHDAGFRTFIEQTTRIAKAAGVTTVAEGIEDSACLDLMLTMGLTSAQGYLIARPLPASAVKLWLETWQPSDPVGFTAQC
jgi:EAL domain-containing protein (putative c-di-GMP-specific phosphodiesterase class I)